MSRAAICTKISTLIALAGAACSGKSEPPPPATTTPPPPLVARDAGTTVISGFDPASGMHLDDDGAGSTRPAAPRDRAGHSLQVTLRSTPSGAIAAVDGVQVGPTPTYWFGEADGREHEFTFVRSGYESARYRFVPVQSGLVHARLEPVADERVGSGLGPEIAPVFAPDAGVVAPPPTVITPSPPPPPPPPPAADTPVRIEPDGTPSKQGPQP
jgi:hypothetical protein